MKIVYIGAGFVGTPSAAVTALKCPQHQVFVLDMNEQRIQAWNSLTGLPFYEPGLEDILKQVKNVNLHFVTDKKSTLADCDMVFICVNVPVNSINKTLSEYSVNFEYFDSCLRDIVNYCSNKKLVTIVQKSTVPVNCMRRIHDFIAAKQFKTPPLFDVLSNPEFLAESTAVNDLIHPNRVIIGCYDKLLCSESKILAMERLGALYKNWVDAKNIIYMNSASAELCKLASNAFLAQRLSSINSLVNLCEKTNADIREVQMGVSADRRIGRHYLNSSFGYGGSCLEKDVNILSIVLSEHDEINSSCYWKSVNSINKHTVSSFADKIIKYCIINKYRENIAFFGVTFKENTSDTRNSPAVTLAKELLKNLPNKLNIYDETANATSILNEFSHFTERIDVYNCPYKAANNTGVIVVAVNANSFKTIDWYRMRGAMSTPCLVFDGKFCLDANVLIQSGIVLWSFGR